MAILTMTIVMQALTSTDDDEISTCLKQLKASAAGTLPSYHPWVYTAAYSSARPRLQAHVHAHAHAHVMCMPARHSKYSRRKHAQLKASANLGCRQGRRTHLLGTGLRRTRAKVEGLPTLTLTLIRHGAYA
eukprot:scaffold60483_cov39-Phaeocystis_antarctica.AAC.1